MQTRQNIEKMAKCGDFFSGARGNAKLMINFFGLSACTNIRRMYTFDNQQTLRYQGRN